jgi:hypothetical protein
VNNFNAGIFKYLLFVATNGGGTERNRSKIGKDLKAWMKNKNPDRSALTTDWIKIQALNCVINFPWSVTQYNSSYLGKWVNNQRQSKK